MDITFDQEADALYIQFRPGRRVKKTLKIRDGLLVDMDRSGRIFGIEILDASHRIPRSELGHLNIRLPVHI